MKWTPNTATNRSKNGSRIRDLGIERWVRCRHRRISKIVQRLSVTTAPPPSPPVETYEWNNIEYRTFAYDDWNLIHETVVAIDGGTTNVSEVQYFWGLDLSDSLQGAGGVGGLLAVSSNGQFYFPTFDNNGNITKYIGESGNVVAAYEYDDFGRVIAQSGTLADFFRHRFSTKYFDVETGLYYYGYRFYAPMLMRWLNRDPMGEDGGNNLYEFCGNAAVNGVDVLGAVEYKGKSNTSGFFYEFVVGKCEVAIIYGHGHQSLPHKISFEDPKTSSAYFWGCWPDITNASIPRENRLMDNVGQHTTMYDDAVFEKLKASREEAIRRAKEICKTECCKNGVWVRYQFSPSDNFGVRILDWLKGNSSRNQSSRLVGGGVWEGDTHVNCK